MRMESAPYHHSPLCRLPAYIALALMLMSTAVAIGELRALAAAFGHSGHARRLSHVHPAAEARPPPTGTSVAVDAPALASGGTHGSQNAETNRCAHPGRDGDVHASAQPGTRRTDARDRRDTNRVHFKQRRVGCSLQRHKWRELVEE